MTIMVDYLRKWRLQLSIGKTVSAACHLNNIEAKRVLDVFVDNKRLVFQQDPKYLGVRLDRMPTSSNTLKKWQERLNSESHSSVVLLVQHVEPLSKHYGSPRKPWYSLQLNVWSRSPHVKKVDVAINSSLWTVSGCLKPAPVFQLHVLAGIAPCGPKTESSHPRIGMESNETRLEHPARHHKE